MDSDNTFEHKPEERICVGLLAHVDAGKTTLAEGMLYLCGNIRKLGRVDHGDAFLDTHGLERARGITIFSKQAQLNWQGRDITLLDTPGHVDFSAEMERTLQILDYAVLIINGADGVQGQTETLFKLADRYQIPVFLFVNKMDQEGAEREVILEEIHNRLGENCLDFSGKGSREELWENLALCEEKVMDSYLQTGAVTQEEIGRLIKERKIFPCYFGSALKLTGVEELLEGIAQYGISPDYPEQFGARVFKIARDAQGKRLTYLKITGGSLRVKTPLRDQRHSWEEKVDQIRIYSGEGFLPVQEAKAGTVCAVTGLGATYAGEGLGAEELEHLPLLAPVLNYRVFLPKDCQVHAMLRQLRQLEEEEPLLHILWEEELEEIHVQLMGEVQLEVLKTLVKERFDVDISFGAGSILYKETILGPVEGVGHFEPLRHYAEVHLLLEPLEQGSGLQFENICSEDMLDRNWQRQILNHLKERRHRGVLIGAELTDVKITLVSGRAHLKHTEGGDFRQAAGRAVRQGLKKAKSRLLEPVYQFRLELPSELVGRGMADIQRMYGSFLGPETEGDMSVLTGTAPVAKMQGYQSEVTSYTRGQGRLFCSLQGYAPCHNEEEVKEAAGYDSESDLEQPAGSVFCAHGAGFAVSWDQVFQYMHLESILPKEEPPLEEAVFGEVRAEEKAESSKSGYSNEKELEDIFKRTYGEGKQARQGWKKIVSHQRNVTEQEIHRNLKPEEEREYLLVDGYNIIFGWEELNELAKGNLEAARGKLMDILCNYQGYKKNILILVFDAYRVEGNPGADQEYHNIHVVYTKEAETADQYIERVTHEIGRRYKVTVATSDALEQVIIMGQGAKRMSAKGLKEEIEAVNGEIAERLKQQKKPENRQYLFEQVSGEMAEELEKVRLGEKEHI